jgi:ferredoxin
VASVIEKRCTGCRLCEQVCGWEAIYIDPPREILKKRLHPAEEPTGEAAAVGADHEAS